MSVLLVLFVLFCPALLPAFAADAAGEAAAQESSFMRFALPDGTPLRLEHRSDNDILIMPKGADRVQMTLNSANYLTEAGGSSFGVKGRKIAPDAGSDRVYTLTLSDTALKGENLYAFRSYQYRMRGSGAILNSSNVERAERGKARYEFYDSVIDESKTSEYSEIVVQYKNGGQIMANFLIRWQVDLPSPKDLSAAGATLYTPFVTDGSYHLYQAYILDKGAKEAVFRFTPSDGAEKIYLTDEELKPIDGAVKKGSGGAYEFTVKLDDFGEGDSMTRYLMLENKAGTRRTVSFIGSRRHMDERSPDAITDYLCIGSQYSDGGNQLTGVYGLYPEKSLRGFLAWHTPISLGNFGGYITYYYEDAIQNDPAHPYGVDFIVYGNSNGGSGFSEPGNVLVSEDGETWYTLAGSEHYEDATKWGAVVVYERDEAGYTIANGVSLSSYYYPSPENYPLHDWTQDKEESVTVTGVGLGNKFPAFGYVDVHTNTPGSWGVGGVLISDDARAGNPYLRVTAQKQGLNGPSDMDALYEGAGDCFDLAWAVDENGLPASIDEIHYIKVQSALGSGIKAGDKIGGTGEPSTEVNAVSSVPANKTPVGLSAAPTRILVDGVALSLKEGQYEYSARATGDFTVEVKAKDDANVYINNLRDNSREFAKAPDKGLIRVIVQEGEKEPRIYVIRVS
jgi:hypothetical protein